MDKQEFIILDVLYVEDEMGEAIELPIGTIIMFAPGDPMPQVMKTDRGAWGVRAGHVMPRVDVDARKYWFMPDDFTKMIQHDAGWALIVRTMIQKKRRNLSLAKRGPDRSIRPYFEIEDALVVKLEAITNVKPIEVMVTMRDDIGEKSVALNNPLSLMDDAERTFIRPYLKR